MTSSRYSIRGLRAPDIDTALTLMSLANPDYDEQELEATRHLLEMATASAGSGPTEEGLRSMSRELANLSGGVLTADDAYRKLRERTADGENPLSDAMVTLVAEETATGQVVGLVNAGPPGKWSHHAVTRLPAPMVHQMRDRVVEISDIAVLPGARRQGLGGQLIDALLNLDSERARGWRMAVWFFHENRGFGDWHRSLCPEWPVGRPITFLDSERQPASFRELNGDLRACVAPLHPDLKLVMDPTGVPAIDGVFDQPWPQLGPALPRTKPSKADRKREKRQRGRARG
ncbi:GNAT family N-acetyltransferase [Streptomyces sp. NPDC097619]|uniref:GNAT family N-acetyltransferase n=1 Tax=Streptomyces sp. NPDC097619 TaxID=3157228 RepID=UPI003328D3F1